MGTPRIYLNFFQIVDENVGHEITHIDTKTPAKYDFLVLSINTFKMACVVVES